MDYLVIMAIIIIVSTDYIVAIKKKQSPLLQVDYFF